jgi:hypothetical protein
MFDLPCYTPCTMQCRQVWMPPGRFAGCRELVGSRYVCCPTLYTGVVQAQDGVCHEPQGSICQCDLYGRPYEENVIDMPCFYQEPIF